MPLVVETGSGRDPLAQSYASLAVANEWHNAGVNAEAWSFIDPPDQERALVAATRLLDATVDWKGAPVYGDQPLGWPRRNVRGIDRRPFSTSAVPNAVRYATAALALKLAQDQVAALAAEAAGATTTGGATEQAVEEITLGPIGIKLSSATAATVEAQAAAQEAANRLVPVDIAAMIKHWGDYAGGNAAMVRVVRA